MIARPTVFILGAGASAPYGFPLGTALSDEIAGELLSDSDFRADLCRSGFKLAVVEQFARDLQEAGRYSIDEYLQWRKDYRDLGKLAIARSLIPHESEERLKPAAKYKQWSPAGAADTRWYRYFFNQLLTSRRRGQCPLNANRVTFLTFNFDRSFERALYLFACANCAATEADASAQIQQVPIHHLHGQLGHPAWLSPQALPAAGSRLYDAQETGSATLRMCAAQIRIVDDEVIDSPQLRAALSALEDAEVVIFLGFSYHGLNLPKIQIEKLKGKQVFGTAYQLPPGRRSAVERTFKEAGIDIQLAGTGDHVLTFLENTDLIYD